MKQNKIRTQISLEPTQYEQARRYAFDNDLSLSELIRQGLDLRMKQERKSIYGKQMFEEIAGKKKV